MVRKGRKKRERRSSQSDAVRPSPKNEGCSGAAVRAPRKRQGDSSLPLPRKSEISLIVDKLGNYGLILLLFESPTGFAVFAFDGVQLFLPKAEENIWANFVKDYMTHRVIWLKEFKSFKNKANVFNHTGVNSELAEMIRRWHTPGQLLAVGKPDYKKIIEYKLKITCLYNDAVLEVMWGIKNLMKSLLPLEYSELSKEDRLQMSYGMKSVLSRHGFDVTPEMVTEDIIEYACNLYDCDLYETKHSGYLTSCGECLEEISGIQCEGWSPMKLATALKILCLPDDVEEYDPALNFTEDELTKLRSDGPEYDGVLLKRTSVSIYRDMMNAREIKADIGKKLELLIPRRSEADVKHEGPSSEADVKQEVPSPEAAVIQEMPGSEAAAMQEMPGAEAAAMQEMPGSEAAARQELPSSEAAVRQEVPEF